MTASTLQRAVFLLLLAAITVAFFWVLAPYSGAVYDLAADRLLEAPEGIRITKKKRASSGIFERLIAAGQRLLIVIKHNEGGANKDLAKFADQINAIADKWDR